MESLSNECLNALRQALANNGCFLKIGDDMFEWCARMKHHDCLINPQYWWPNIRDQESSGFLIVFDGEDRPLSTMCWRFVHSNHFVRNEFESGTVFYDNPENKGWGTYRSGVNDVYLAGNLMSRGGIFSWNRGKKLSWFMTTAALAIGLREGADYSVGMAYPEIAKAGLPHHIYGYRHQRRCRPHRMPWDGKLVDLTLLWSDRMEMADEVEERCALLHATYDDDLATIASAYKRSHQPQKTAMSL